ncbi:carboxypeptidase-like regulatory domain-containing protein [Mucilaginibacter mali]|uniref:Carboxypeptidase-like regulatory domain-containing protein n=1 Tax=Mucilaginibacter mali TaxID=2740462 RepID=A0A7D4PZW7_9SPHI|nr:carboxypeptidase-like regulatory domain-containing protein [Mucilaginibacter mali]QKJ29266.1 carboxypeptidase-like regulatory domain-containing protein [Mucilaginibacter mali]
MLKNLIILFLLFPATVFAQSVITGSVLTKAGNAVPDASVFLSNASVGSKTLENGAFTLNNVKYGQYDLVVSCIGFETYHETVLVNAEAIALPAIHLSPKITELKEVTIQYDSNRDRHVKMFLDEFLGHSENAMQCKLLNPEILNLTFEKSTGKLTGSTDDFLVIENKALGYNIKYLLASFEWDPQRGYVSYTGSSVFEPMTGKSSDEKRWQKARIKAYRGSDMHFLRACIGQQVAEEGFTVYPVIRKPNPDRPADSLIRAKLQKFRPAGSTRILLMTDSLRYWSEKSRLPKYIDIMNNTPIKSADYIKLTQKKGIYAFGYPNLLRIHYKSTGNSSMVTFEKEYAYFDNNGIILTPHYVLIEGSWAFNRIAELLPVDYELPATF